MDNAGFKVTMKGFVNRVSDRPMKKVIFYLLFSTTRVYVTELPFVSFVAIIWIIGTLSKEDDDGSENVVKKMNLRSFKLNRVYLDLLNMSNAGDFSWS